MTTWADIQRLAADLQRVQLASAAQKLSDRNCVEVVTKLLEAGSIDVVFTRDGTAYITRSHLATMVQNEVAGAGGRFPVANIASNLNVHLEHVENVLGKILGEGQHSYTNGELISREYIVQLHTELRLLLEECGLRSISFLARHWDLPSDTLIALLTPLPLDLRAVMDGEQIYTHQYMESMAHLLRAVFSSITKATPLATIIARSDLPVARFNALLEELIAKKEIAGRFVGSRSSPSCLFVPSVHDRLVALFIKRTLQQNEFIELSMFRKLSLGDPKSALAQIVGTDRVNELTFLPSLVCDNSVIERAHALLDEELEKKSIAVSSLLISQLDIPLNNEDAIIIMERLANGNNKLSVEGDVLFSSDIVTRALAEVKASSKLSDKAVEWVERRFDKKANKEEPAVPAQKKGAAPVVSNKDEDDWDDKGKKGKGKKAVGKDKGGKGGGKASTSASSRDDDKHSSPHISTEELEEWLDNVPPELRSIIAEQIQPQVETALAESVRNKIASREMEATQSTKKAHLHMRDSALEKYTRIALFEAGASHFGEALSSDLRSFLLKSLCTDLASDLLLFASSTPSSSPLSQKQRDETIASLPSTAKNAFTEIFSSLKGDSLDSFHDALQRVCSRTICDLPLSSVDKEAKAAATNSYCTVLEEEGRTNTEPASALLAIILLIHARNGRVVHASGKFVSSLLPPLKDNVDEETLDLLSQAQSLVVAAIKKKGKEDENDTKSKLEEVMNTLKQKIIPSTH